LIADPAVLVNKPVGWLAGWLDVDTRLLSELIENVSIFRI